jgi:hypothetical protein
MSKPDGWFQADGCYGFWSEYKTKKARKFLKKILHRAIRRGVKKEIEDAQRTKP